MGPHFMLLLSIYVLYSNVTYIYIYIYIYISCIVSCGNKLVPNCFNVITIKRTELVHIEYVKLVVNETKLRTALKLVGLGSSD